jgi:hypothetical protein
MDRIRIPRWALRLKLKTDLWHDLKDGSATYCKASGLEERANNKLKRTVRREKGLMTVHSLNCLNRNDAKSRHI